MSGKVIIVTGASSGIGYEVARILCEGGNDVILACRSEEKANRCIEKIKKQNPSALATFQQLDLASLESIHKFVDGFHTTEKKLTALVNNAGTFQNIKDTRRQYTKENFELAMGTNHLGHFLLTNLLLGDLKKAASEGEDARIVIVTSSLHDTEQAKKKGAVNDLDVENFFLSSENTFNGLQAYKNSKLANVLFTFELARQIEGSGVKVNAICPGFAPSTDLMRSASSAVKFYSRFVLHGMLRFRKVTRTPQQAAACICALAVDEKFKEVHGKYFQESVESKSSEESMSEEKQKQVWKLSGGYTHLEGFEPLDAPAPPVEPEVKPEAKKEEPATNGDATKPAEESVATSVANAQETKSEEVVKSDEKEVEKVDETKAVEENVNEIQSSEVKGEEKKMNEVNVNAKPEHEEKSKDIVAEEIKAEEKNVAEEKKEEVTKNEVTDTENIIATPDAIVEDAAKDGDQSDAVEKKEVAVE